MEGMRGFKFGAAALAQFALSQRAKMWHLLAWHGRHSQAPVAVAQRPHYFSELDVPRTIRHLLRWVPFPFSSPGCPSFCWALNGAACLAVHPAASLP
jgi:hypothetical protein